MLQFAWTVVLYACLGGLVVGEYKVAPSPLVYEAYASGLYLFDPSPNTWVAASKVCKTYNGHLAFPKSQDEADVLWSMMTLNNVSQVSVGFHDQFTEGNYYAVKGELVNETSFNKWSAGAPTGGSSNNCGGLKGDGFVDVDCNALYPFICEGNDPEPDLRDYEYVEGHGYFKYVSFPRIDWPVAMEVCRGEGSHLWIVNSAKEQRVVLETFRLVDEMVAVWVGVHHKYEDKYFVTVYDDAIESTGYVHWAVGEPRSNNHNPYVMVVSNQLGLYTSSWATRGYICEYNPVL